MITPRRGPLRKHILYCWRGVFTAPLYSNGSYSSVACLFVAGGMCLPTRCLTMNVYSDFTIPIFGRHVTIWRLEYTPGSYLSRGMVKHESWKLHRSMHLALVIRTLNLRMFIYTNIIGTVLYYYCIRFSLLICLLMCRVLFSVHKILQVKRILFISLGTQLLIIT
jgi:hypothetical protein